MIICCGEALIDMVRASVPGLKGGFISLPGGSPYNTAIAIGKLGAPVKFLGRFSTDFFGETLLKRLRDSHVGDDLILRSDQNSTLAFAMTEKGKDPQYIFYTDGTAARSLTTDDLPPKLPADTKCIVFGSISLTMEPIASAVEALIFREGTRRSADLMDGAPVISFDPNIRSFMIKDRNTYIEKFEKWVAASTIAKISSADFELIYPKLDPEKALRKILAMGPRLAICTLGSRVALALLRRNDGNVSRVSAPAVNLPVADTIGAGDTFHGAFLAWLEIKGKMTRSALANISEADLFEALFFANKAASLVCSRHGAEPPTKREVDGLRMPLQKSAAKADAKGSVKGKTEAAKKPAAKGKPSAVKKLAAKASPKKSPAVKPKAVKPTSSNTKVKKPIKKK